MPTIEEMRTELEAAGYRLQINDLGRGNFFEIRYEDSQYGDIQFEPWYNPDDTVKKAYAHYLQQQRSAKMETFLQEIVNHGDGLIIDYWIGRAKKLLAEKETS